MSERVEAMTDALKAAIDRKFAQIAASGGSITDASDWMDTLLDATLRDMLTNPSAYRTPEAIRHLVERHA